eukprot:4439911-Alexandrium_andersonii.AAC.1
MTGPMALMTASTTGRRTGPWWDWRGPGSTEPGGTYAQSVTRTRPWLAWPTRGSAEPVGG